MKNLQLVKVVIAEQLTCAIDLGFGSTSSSYTFYYAQDTPALLDSINGSIYDYIESGNSGRVHRLFVGEGLAHHSLVAEVRGYNNSSRPISVTVTIPAGEYIYQY